MSPRPQPAPLRVTPLEERRLPAGFYPTFFTTQSVALHADYTGTSWNVDYSNLGKSVTASALTDSAVYVPPAARVAAPAGPAFTFIGVTGAQGATAGQAYILPQTQDLTLPYLGINATATAGSLTSYQPLDTRVAGVKPWVRIDVAAVRGPAKGKVSAYQTTAGVPTAWVSGASSAGVSAKDSFYVAAGTTQQYSWAFTLPGVYQVDVTATGFRGPNQTMPTTSPVQTLSFAVDAPGPTNAVPASGAISAGGKPIIFTAGGNALSVAGPTVAPAPVRTTLSVLNGTLALGATSGVGVVSGDTSATVTVTGTIDQVNTALNGVVYTPTPAFNGVETVTVTTSDLGAYRPAALEQTATNTFTVLVSGNPAVGVSPPGVSPPAVVPPTYPVGSSQNLPRYEAIGAAVGAAGAVSVVDTETRLTLATFTPYEASFTGGVRVAVADLRRTGVPEVVTGPATGGAARIQVFGAPGQPARLNFFAFDPSFTGGVTLATADVNGDGFPDIVVGAGPGGGPRVAVFDGRNGVPIRTFFAFESGFRGGVSVAAGDVNGDGRADIVVGAGPGGGPAVAVFDGANPANVRRFFAYAPTFRGGVNVAVGNVTASGVGAIVVGAGVGGGPHVQVYDGKSLATVASFFASPVTPQTVNGVQVSVSDLKRDLTPEVVTVSPAGLTDPTGLRSFDLTASSFRPQGDDVGLTDVFNGGVFVAGVV